VARVKRGVPAHKRHKRLLALTKGHRGSNHLLYKRAHESMLHALSYAYAHRRERKGDMRRLWIVRIGAASRELGLSYSQFMHGLKLANIELDRKTLSEMAIHDPAGFDAVFEQAKSALAA
jgi:large subunit ribosomal protein L20